MIDETRTVLIEKALKLGIEESLLQNLTYRSIKEIVEHERKIKEDKRNGTREIPGYRA
jgi:hypothetical protein